MTAVSSDLPRIFACRTRCGRNMRSTTGRGSGYCDACYTRWQRAGFPQDGPPPPKFLRPESAAVSETAEPTTGQLAGLLAQGISQRTIAAQLGLSHRSVRDAAAALYGSRAQQAATPAIRKAGPACAGMNPVLFFGRDGERQHERAIREERAKAVCAACPVQRECFETAMGRPEKRGIWGGLNEDERLAVRKRLYQDRKNAARRVTGRQEQDAEVAA